MPVLGCAGICTPGSAPSTPASNEPSVISLPFSCFAVSSPKYHTLPARSCANHSSVYSTTFPVRLVTVDRTTRAVTPSAMTFVLPVTSSTIRCLVPSGAVSR
jgi:hypothetical protein